MRNQNLVNKVALVSLLLTLKMVDTWLAVFSSYNDQVKCQIYLNRIYIYIYIYIYLYTINVYFKFICTELFINTIIIYCKYTLKFSVFQAIYFIFCNIICCQSIPHLQYIKDIGLIHKT